MNELPLILRQNVMTTEHFLTSSDWNLEQLDAYAEYCNKELKNPNCITQENKIKFLEHYKALRGSKK